MQCEKCGALIKPGEMMEHNGRKLCEDCYIHALSPSRTCDPWAVYTAKSFSGRDAVFTPLQAKILKILEETGGVEPGALAEMLHMPLSEVEREFATLRHMEKARAKMQDGKKVICLW